MPGRGYLQKFLRRAARAECNYALVEVTSQAVVQHRHRFIHWNMGVLTNLAPEHIESHGSFENYRAAKLDFLKYVIKKGGKVFLNRDDKNFDFFMEALGDSEPIAYSKDDEFFHDSLPHIRSTRMRRDSEAPHFLMSPFNEENIAVAVAIAKELGIANKIIEDAIMEFEGVPGRMEFVHVRRLHRGRGLCAHAGIARGRVCGGSAKTDVGTFRRPRLICVLGAAGGGRDTWKRPAMGTIAADHCDEIILTNEDPYDEDPQAIMDEIETGIPQPLREGQHVYKILDRVQAIEKAVALANEGDVVIGTGKGSEDWIHAAGGRKIPWNERAVFDDALAKRVGK